jgi:hypothetical protein
MPNLHKIAAQVSDNLVSLIETEIAGLDKIVSDTSTIRIGRDESGRIEIVEIDPNTGAENYYTLSVTIQPK